jgi:hypothetical protein
VILSKCDVEEGGHGRDVVQPGRKGNGASPKAATPQAYTASAGNDQQKCPTDLRGRLRALNRSVVPERFVGYRIVYPGLAASAG